MKSTITTLFAGLLLPLLSFGQWQKTQYFDGADTAASYSIQVELDTSASNVWQVGRPQKILFDKASTLPNALITDTINTYPVNANSSATFGVNANNWGGAILAIHWNQKLDMERDHDGGIVEFSLDSGVSWQNAFNHPDVYNFYGFLPQNKDTLMNGEYAFSGQDTGWRNVWICFARFNSSVGDSIMMRFTLLSDSVDNSREGWMIDNLVFQETFIHTVNEYGQPGSLTVQPNPTSGIVNIATKKSSDPQLIDKLELLDLQGRLVREMVSIPSTTQLNFSQQPDGVYLLRLKTSEHTEVMRLVIRHD